MDHRTDRRRTALSLALTSLITALVAAGPAPAAMAVTQSQATASASVTLVHGVRGLLADVVVDGRTVLKGFAYERASSPLALPAGTHRVQVYQAGQPHTTALLDVRLPVRPGQVITAAVGFDGTGAPKAFVFDDTLAAAARSASSIVIRNVSQGPAPEVLVDGRAASSGLAPGAQVIRSTQPGRHSVGLKVGGSWLLTNQPVQATSGRATVVYVVGRQSAKSVALVANSVTPRFSASAVNSGGQPPAATGSVRFWLSGAALLAGLIVWAGLLLAHRRRTASATGTPYAA